MSARGSVCVHLHNLRGEPTDIHATFVVVPTITDLVPSNDVDLSGMKCLDGLTLEIQSVQNRVG